MEKITIDSKFADQDGEVMVVELGGHVDQSNSYQLQKMFDSIIQSGCFKVIVDFKNLFYMSSAGWGVFVGEIKRFRENGGDIKLATMNPEIYDVYQMLEFYHILDDYPRVEDAAASFGKDTDELDLVPNEPDEHEPIPMPVPEDTAIEEIDLTKDEKTIEMDVTESRDKKDAVAEVIDFIPNGGQGSSFKEGTSKEFIPHTLQKDVKLAELPKAEKVKRVVAENPLVGIWGIRRVLRHEHFGKTRMGIFELWRLLRDLDLNNKHKRYRYYRSC